MFCCAVCQELFKGVYPEKIVATPCGHVFHMACITMCLKRLPKCPFCSVHVDQRNLLKLQLTFERNWKDLILNNKTANKSIINLDNTAEHNLSHDHTSLESINMSMDKCNKEDTWISVLPNRIDSSVDSDESALDLNADISSMSLDDTLVECNQEIISCVDPNIIIVDGSSMNLPALPIFNEDKNLGRMPKTLLTTSLSSNLLNQKMECFLSILNNIIPNSTIKTRLLVSELNLITTAQNEGYTHIIIIIMSLGYPSGLNCIDILNNLKVYAELTSFTLKNGTHIFSSLEYPKLVINREEKLNKFQDSLFYFFSSIFFKKLEKNREEIHLINCENCQVIKFIYDTAGLSFCLGMPSLPNDDSFLNKIF